MMRWVGGIAAVTFIALGVVLYSSQVWQVRAISALGVANWRVEPVKIAENVYYVGGFDAASYLITGTAGHILIDGGYADTAPMILDNIRRLGFQAHDVKIILNTHGHFDHAAGIAALKRATGAKLYVSPEEARLIEAGGRGDFHFADQFPYEPVSVDHRLADREQISLGGPVLTAQFTPGHTKGCTSWSWTAIADGVPRSALLICSLSQLGAPLVGNRAYPSIALDWAASFARLEKLGCEVFLTPHGTQFDVRSKAELVMSGNAAAFVDPVGCKAFIRSNRDAFRDAKS